LPRFFEAGILPLDAFLKMITTFNNIHIIFGVAAWIVMLLLGLTSCFRSHLSIHYETWKMIHGTLSVIFIIFSAWHAIGLGRHINQTMAIFIAIVAIGGITFFMLSFFPPHALKGKVYAE